MSFDPIQEHRLPHLLVILIPNTVFFQGICIDSYRTATIEEQVDCFHFQQNDANGKKCMKSGVNIHERDWLCEHAVQKVPAPGAEEPNLQEGKHTRAHLTARMRVASSHPDE